MSVWKEGRVTEDPEKDGKLVWKGQWCFSRGKKIKPQSFEYRHEGIVVPKDLLNYVSFFTENDKARQRSGSSRDRKGKNKKSSSSKSSKKLKMEKGGAEITVSDTNETDGTSLKSALSHAETHGEDNADAQAITSSGNGDEIGNAMLQSSIKVSETKNEGEATQRNAPWSSLATMKLEGEEKSISDTGTGKATNSSGGSIEIKGGEEKVGRNHTTNLNTLLAPTSFTKVNSIKSDLSTPTHDERRETVNMNTTTSSNTNINDDKNNNRDDSIVVDASLAEIKSDDQIENASGNVITTDNAVDGDNNAGIRTGTDAVSTSTFKTTSSSLSISPSVTTMDSLGFQDDLSLETSHPLFGLWSGSFQVHDISATQKLETEKKNASPRPKIRKEDGKFKPLPPTISSTPIVHANVSETFFLFGFAGMSRNATLHMLPDDPIPTTYNELSNSNDSTMITPSVATASMSTTFTGEDEDTPGSTALRMDTEASKSEAEVETNIATSSISLTEGQSSLSPSIGSTTGSGTEIKESEQKQAPDANTNTITTISGDVNGNGPDSIQAVSVNTSSNLSDNIRSTISVPPPSTSTTTTEAIPSLSGPEVPLLPDTKLAESHNLPRIIGFGRNQFGRFSLLGIYNSTTHELKCEKRYILSRSTTSSKRGRTKNLILSTGLDKEQTSDTVLTSKRKRVGTAKAQGMMYWDDAAYSLPSARCQSGSKTPRTVSQTNRLPSANTLEIEREAEEEEEERTTPYKYASHFEDSGEIYEGGWANGARNGIGICVYPDGAMYEGDWLNGREHGKGLLMMSDRTIIYDGEWQDGVMAGKGKYIFANGDIYTGDMREGLRHGHGEYKLSNGCRYVGQWRDHKRHGTGTFHWPDNSYYDGDWENDLRHGKGLLVLANGFSYDGSWMLNFMEGRGTTYFPNGQQYQGSFRLGLREGRGSITFPEGALYEGRFREDHMDGQGTLKVTGVVPGAQDGETLVPIEVQADIKRIQYKTGFSGGH